jgi:hypothetical protein
MRRIYHLLDSIVLFLLCCFVLNCTEPPTKPSTPPPGSTSNGIFTVTGPAAGSIVRSDQSLLITWVTGDTAADPIARITLYRSDTLVATISTVASKSGIYTWSMYSYSIPSGSNYHIKIASATATDTSRYDMGGYFTIRSAYTGTIVVTEPTASTSAHFDSSMTIRWIATDSIGAYVRIQLYNDSALVTSISTMVSASLGAYTWNLASYLLASGTKYRIKILSYYDAGINAFSPYFAIRSGYSGTITVTEPVATTAAHTDSALTIRWTKTGSLGSYLRLQLYNDTALVYSITTSAYSDTGYYVWSLVSSSLSSGTRYRIKASCYYDAGIYGFSDYFTIKTGYAGTIAITAPVDTTVFRQSTYPVITWTTTGTIGTYVRIQLYSDSTLLSTLTSSAYATTGSYSNWYVSSSSYPAGTRYRIRISSYADSSISTFSSYFRIASQYYGSFAFTNPVATSIFAAGTSYQVQWATTGAPGSYINLALYRDSTLVTSIIYDTYDYGYYSWSVSNGLVSSNRYRLKISSYYDTTIAAFSSYFTISGTTPDAFEPDNIRSQSSTATLGTAQNHTLTTKDTDWVSFTLDSGKVYLFNNDGVAPTYNYLYDSTASSYLTYYYSSSSYSGKASLMWVCPKTGRYYDRITSYSSSYLGAYSFKVSLFDTLAMAKFVAPDSATIWSSGTSYYITWTPDTALFGTYVSLYLFDETGRKITAIYTDLSNSGSYYWTVPAGLASRSTYRIKLVNYSNSSLYGYSKRFSIAGIVPDSMEIDDSASVASGIAVNGTVQNRSLTGGDIDWIKFPVVKDSLYVIRVAGTIYPYVYLYSRPDSSYVMYKYGTSNLLVWKATATRNAYLRISPYSTSTSYYGPYTVSVRQTSESSICTFTNPVSTSVWASSSLASIQWTADTAIFGQYVSIQLYKGQDLKETIYSSATNNGLYSWTVPAGMASGSDYRVKITSSSYTTYGFSGYFTISGIVPDTFEVDDSIGMAKPIATDGAVQRHNLTRNDIDWMTFNAAALRMYVINAACSTYTNVRLYSDLAPTTMITGATGSSASSVQFAWFCATAGKYDLQISPQSTTYTGGYGVSVQAYDSTAYRLQVTGPAAGATLVQGNSATITWSSQVNAGGLVDIFLFDANGIVSTIVSGAANSGSYAWLIPATVSTGSSYYVKVISRVHSAIGGSSGVFTVTQ